MENGIIIVLCDISVVINRIYSKYNTCLRSVMVDCDIHITCDNSWALFWTRINRKLLIVM